MSPSTRLFLGTETCDAGYDWKIYHYASVVHAEARGEGRSGMVAVISALRNGARGYKVGKLDPMIVELVAEEMKKPVGHPYKHWIRLVRATDKAQLRKAKRAIRRGDALKVGRHWFF